MNTSENGSWIKIIIIMIIFIISSSKSTFIIIINIIIMLKTRQKHFVIGGRVGQVQPAEYSKSMYIMQIKIFYAKKKKLV